MIDTLAVTQVTSRHNGPTSSMRGLFLSVSEFNCQEVTDDLVGPSQDNSKEGSDHDIQQLVGEEDRETKHYQEKSEGDAACAHKSDASEHIHNENGHEEDGKKDDEQKEKPKVEYKVHSEGVKVDQSSDFWNNYKLDIDLAKDLGEHTRSSELSTVPGDMCVVADSTCN